MADFERGDGQVQFLDLRLEGAAEEVVNERVVEGGGLGEHAGQQADLGRDAATVPEDGPQTHQAVGRPAADEAQTNEDSNLEKGTVGDDRWNW